jgi:hypothetical protein
MFKNGEECGNIFLFLIYRFRIDGNNNNNLKFNNMYKNPLKGTTKYYKHKIIFDIPEDSNNFVFGLVLQGKGKVFIKDIYFKEYEN